MFGHQSKLTLWWKKQLMGYVGGMFIFHCSITPYFTSLVLNKYALNSFTQQISENVYCVRWSFMFFKLCFFISCCSLNFKWGYFGVEMCCGEVNSFLMNLLHTLSFGNDLLYVFSCNWKSFPSMLDFLWPLSSGTVIHWRRQESRSPFRTLGFVDTMEIVSRK